MATILKQYGKVLALTVLINTVVVLVLFALFIPEAVVNRPSQDGGSGYFATLNESVVDIVDEANPAVVSIIVSKDVPVYERYYEDISPFDPFGFFGPSFQVPRVRQKGTEEREVGGGSGFIVSSDGLVVTNKHVVDDEGASYSAFLLDGRQHELEVVARDPYFDIAILKMEGATNVAHLSFGNSDDLKLGQAVIAIGNALNEFRNSVSVGVVSGLSRSIVAGTGFGTSEQLDQVIQTDAAINPGNSGGPLLDLSGDVIGVNVAVAVGSENIGFALPSNVVKNIVSSVERFGEIRHPYLGVRYTMITPSVADELGLDIDYGALIAKGAEGEEAVLPNSPAERAGLREGDIVLEINEEKVTTEQPLSSYIRNSMVGETVTLTILRNGRTLKVPVTLEEAQ